MLTKTNIILAASLLLGTASAALAGDQTDESGGFVLRGNMEGVNPVYHPDWFNAAQQSAAGTAGQSFGYALPQNDLPKKQQPRAPRIKTQDK
jgi:hypothetical protein